MSTSVADLFNQYEQNKTDDKVDKPQIPDGKYEAVITSTSLKSASTGNRGVTVKVTLSEGAYKGTQLWGTVWYGAEGDSDALQKFFRLATQLGLSGEFFKSNPTWDQIALALKDRPCNVTTSTETYNGVTSSKVNWVNKPTKTAVVTVPAAVPSQPEVQFTTAATDETVEATPAVSPSLRPTI
jgi:hypothetical protein